MLRNQSVRCVFIHIYDWGYEHANYTTDVLGGQFGCLFFFCKYHSNGKCYSCEIDTVAPPCGPPEIHFIVVVLEDFLLNYFCSNPLVRQTEQQITFCFVLCLGTKQPRYMYHVVRGCIKYTI